MIVPTVTVGALLVALWASAVGRGRLVLAAVAVACLAGSWGYVTASGLPLAVTVPRAALGCLAAVLFIAALIVACNRGEGA